MAAIRASSVAELEVAILNSANNLEFVQRLRLERKLDAHNGCVNSICWNSSGEYILSGSDDQNLVISNPFTGEKVETIISGHRANIFSAKFLPNSNDKQIVSCSGDGKIFYTDLNEETRGKNCFDCHTGTAYEVVVVPNEPSTFLTCGEDGTVRWFDLRLKTKCNKEDCKEDILINCRRPITTLAVNPVLPYQLGVACSDSAVRIFDRRMLGTRTTGNYVGRGITGMMSRFTAPSLEKRSYRITSLHYSHDGEDVLVSYSSQHIYLFGMKDEKKVVPLKKKLPGKSADAPKSADSCSAADLTPDADTAPDADSAGRQPPIKRLRLRGDWSDTGPNARPESERVDDEGTRSPHATIMHRMSDMLTRWLDGNLRQGDDEENPSPASTGAEATGEPSPDGPASNPETTSAPEISGWEEIQVPNNEQPSTSKKADTKQLNSTLKDDVSNEVCKPETNTDPPRTDSKDVIADLSEGTNDGVIKEFETGAIQINQEHMQSKEHNMEILNSARPSLSNSCPSIEAQTHSSSCAMLPSELDNSPRTEGNIVRSLGVPNTSSHVETIDTTSHPERVDATCLSDGTSPDSSSFFPIAHDDIHVIREAYRNQPGLEPIISLHYSNEGTTNSTISVGFAECETENASLEPTTAPDNLSSSTPGPASGDVESEPMETVPMSVMCPDQRKPQADPLFDGLTVTTSCPVDIDSKQATAHAVTDELNDLTPVLEQTSQDQTASAGLVSQPSMTETEGDQMKTGQESEDMSSCKQSFLVDGSSMICSVLPAADSSPVLSETMDNSDCGSVLQTVEQMTIEDSQLDANSPECIPKINVQGDLENVAESSFDSSRFKFENDSSKVVTPTVSDMLRAGPSNSHKSQKPRDRGSADAPRPDGSPSGPDGVHGQAAGATADTKGPHDPGTASASTASTSIEQAVASGSGVRQRRIGRSGPPTGDFQLTADSSDEEVTTHHGRSSSRFRTDMERNIAAIRLQELYRKNRDEKDKAGEMMNVHQPKYKIKFRGHRNARTMIKEANFWGNDYVMTGSDCGHIFIWSRHTAQLVMLLEADRHVVNCLQPHPYLPILASSGIDYDIKIWSPSGDEPCFDREKAEEVMKRNEVMLEETKDTITVPAAFMLRVLASLNQLRSGRQGGQRDREESRDSDTDND